jgi:hypothetical protein
MGPGKPVLAYASVKAGPPPSKWLGIIAMLLGILGALLGFILQFYLYFYPLKREDPNGGTIDLMIVITLWLILGSFVAGLATSIVACCLRGCNRKTAIIGLIVNLGSMAAVVLLVFAFHWWMNRT